VTLLEPLPPPIADPKLETVVETQALGVPTVIESEKTASGVPEEVTAAPTADKIEEDDKTIVEEQLIACPICDALLQPDADFCSEGGHRIG